MGRFIFDKLLQAPWNTTAAYIHSEVQRDGLGRMEINLPQADPSGCKEGYAFVRIDHPTTGSGGAAPGSTRKRKAVDHGKIHGTDRDLRKLSTKEAVAILVSFGMSHTDAKVKLRRWDRIDVIKEYSSRAVAMGYMTEDKFARTGASGDLSAITNASRESSFNSRCQDIWKRQKNALSEMDDMLRDLTMCASVGTTKQLEAAATSAGATGDYATISDITSAPSPEKMANAEECNDGSSGNSSNSDSDSDFDLDAEDDFIESCVADKAQDLVETRKKKRLAQQQQHLSKESESATIKDLLAELTTPEGSVVANAGIAVQESAEVQNSAPTGFHEAAALLGKPVAHTAVMTGLQGHGASLAYSTQHSAAGRRPTHAVRKTTRIVFADGSEEIVIQFFVNEREVKRVQMDQARQQAAKTSSGPSTWEKKYGYRASLPGSRHRAGSMDVDSDDEHKLRGVPTRASTGGLSLKVGKMKRAVSSNLEAESGETYRVKHSSSRGAGFPVYRLPHIAFAAILEAELMSICTPKASQEFWILWNPVPRSYTQYYRLVSNPLSLSDIRENIAAFKYLSYKAFCDDLDLIIYNATLFNGPNSKITAKAKDVKSKLTKALELKRRTLGIDKCPLRNFEEAIRKKFLYLGRALPVTVPVPVHAVPPVGSGLGTGAGIAAAAGGESRMPPPAAGIGSSVSTSDIVPKGEAPPSQDSAPPIHRAVSFLPGFVEESSPMSPASPMSSYSPSSSGNEYSPSGVGYEYSPNAYSDGSEGEGNTSPTSQSLSQSGSSPGGSAAAQDIPDAPTLRKNFSFIPNAASAAPSRGDTPNANPLVDTQEESSSDDDWMIDGDEEEQPDSASEHDSGDYDGDVGMNL